MDVVHPSDPALKHPTMPHRNPVLSTQVVKMDRLRMAANATRFNVDDTARPHCERFRSVVQRVNRFIEADWGAESPL